MDKYTILMGMTNSGKDTIQKYICEHTDYTPIVSYTTRLPRPNEIDGIDYNFVSRRRMLEMIRDDEFIEYRTYNTLVDGVKDTWYYATRKENHFGNNIIILDINGAKSFIEYYGINNCTIIYLDVDKNILKHRAVARGDDMIEFARRLNDDSKVFNEDDLKSINAVKVNNGEIEEIFDEIKKYI